MRPYLDLLEDILEFGVTKPTRQGVDVKSLFGAFMRVDLSKGFPLLTTKEMFFRGIVEELLFFIRADTQSKILEDKKINIWKGNTSREFLDEKGLKYPEGEIGPAYGFQWRNFGGTYIGEDSANPVYKVKDGVDQLAQVIETLRTNPDDRRMVVTAWNPQQNDMCALPPCHMIYQFYVNDNKLSLMWMQRSIDTPLGLPFNVASYALLTHLIASVVGMEVGSLVFAGGDTHIYLNQLDGIRDQVMRTPYDLPTLEIKNPPKSLEDIEEMKASDFALKDYKHHGPIKMPMSA